MTKQLEKEQIKQRAKIQGEALNVIMKHKRSGLGISMGVGKTRIALQHLINNYSSTSKYLVVVPRNTVIDSWNDEMEKIVDQFKDLEAVKQQIVFVNYRSINKLDPTHYNVVYLDECHNLLESHEPFLSAFTGDIVGLTGTPPTKRSYEKYRMVQKYCPIKYEYQTDLAIDDNILNDYKIVIHYLNLDTTTSIPKTNKNGGQWFTSEANDYIYFSNRINDALTSKQQQMSAIMRMRALMDYKTKENYVKSMVGDLAGNCIIFANTKKQADAVCQHSYHSGNPKSDKNLELFSNGEIKRLSCVLQLSEGVTIPNLKQGIIMHSYGNNKKTAQRIGRLLRLSPDMTSICHILCYKNTVDEKWVTEAIKSFDQSKIIHKAYI
jgi:superfamily II DNA or RNA helicase